MRERREGSGPVQNHILSREEEVSLAKLMEKGKKARMVLAENPDIPAEEKRILASQITEGFSARATLITSNLGLIGSIARKYLGHGKGYLELFQEGALGLIRGIDKYNYRRRTKISTPVRWWIRAAITDSFRKSKEALNDKDFPLSLDEPAGDGDGNRAPLGEIVADTFAPTLDERVEEGILRETVYMVCEQILTPEQKEVLYQRFGIKQEGAPPISGRQFVMHNSKAPVLEAALESIRTSPFVGVLLAQLR